MDVEGREAPGGDGGALPPLRLDPHPSRLAPDHPRRSEVVAAHAEAIRRGAPTYRDPISGYAVFTAAAHLERGSCCDSGCRHCPWAWPPGEPGTGAS